MSGVGTQGGYHVTRPASSGILLASKTTSAGESRCDGANSWLVLGVL